MFPYVPTGSCLCVCVAHAHITLRSETSALIDAVSEFGERDGGSGGREIRRERGKQIKKWEKELKKHPSSGAIRLFSWRSVFSFLLLCICQSLNSSSFLSLTLSNALSLTHTHTYACSRRISFARRRPGVMRILNHGRLRWEAASQRDGWCIFRPPPPRLLFTHT